MRRSGFGFPGRLPDRRRMDGLIRSTVFSSRSLIYSIFLCVFVAGWDKGIVGLCKGAKANLVIPPEMAYGQNGAGDVIPGGATLKFDVEVVDIDTNPPPMPNTFKEIDTDADGKLTKEEVEAFFQKTRGVGTPDGLWENEDADSDGFISWLEFGGHKGDNPPGEEL